MSDIERYLVELSASWTVTITAQHVVLTSDRSGSVVRYDRSRYAGLARCVEAAHAGEPPA